MTDYQIWGKSNPKPRMDQDSKMKIKANLKITKCQNGKYYYIRNLEIGKSD
jgi:hypothetical protein